MNSELLNKILIGVLTGGGFFLFLKWALPKLLKGVIDEMYRDRTRAIDEKLSIVDGNVERMNALELARNAHSIELKELTKKCELIPSTNEILEFVRSDLGTFKVEFRSGMEHVAAQIGNLSKDIAKIEGRMIERDRQTDLQS